MATEVRSVGAEAFDEIHPLLERFQNPRMSREDWRWMLFDYPWAGGAARGWLLRVDGAAVGFIGAVFSERTIHGRAEKVCNPSSWIVLEEHRYAASLLLRPILALRDHTLVCLSLSPAAHRMFSRLGLRPLETEQLVLPPVAGLGQLARACRGAITCSPEALRDELEGEARALHRDLAASPAAHHVLLRRDGRSCYLVATRGRRRRLPYADVQYVGDREFFREHRLLAQAALVRAMGLPGLAMAVDRRHLPGPPPRLAARWPVRRLYRPRVEDIGPAQVDGLYSEYMGLRP